MIKTILVDDEERAITSLKITLERNCPEVAIVGTAKSITEARKLIDKQKPQLVFLDINLPDGNGVDLLKSLHGSDLKVIFVTAYDEYVIQALRLSAFDYLMKPIDKEELKNAVGRLKSELLSDYTDQFKVLASFIDDRSSRSIAINTLEGLDIVNTDQILYLSSDGNYSQFHLADRTIVASKPIGNYEELLTQFSFHRIHRSYLVNSAHITSFRRKDSVVVLSDGTNLEVSKRKREDLIQKLQGF